MKNLKCSQIVTTSLIILVFLARTGQAQEAILIEENAQPIVSSKVEPISTKKEIYNSSYEMRANKRVGVGVLTSGYVGALGVNFELNFLPDNSALIGVGGGPGYSSIALGWRNYLSDDFFVPYWGLGFARWESKGDQSKQINQTHPSFLGSKFLTQKELATGKFEKNFLFPSIGVQLSQSLGLPVGVSLFAEIDWLISLEDLKEAPTGALGLSYYF